MKLKTIAEIVAAEKSEKLEKTEAKTILMHTALGMFKDEKTGLHMLAVFNYDETGKVEFVEFKTLNADRNISRDMFKVNVIEKGIIKA